MKKKKATTNPINKCFQYALTVALYHEEVGKHPERMTKFKLFMDKYNWEGLNYVSEKDDWKKSEKNNLTIALNFCLVMYVLSMPQNITQIVKKKIILLMIKNRKGLHYFAVK